MRMTYACRNTCANIFGDSEYSSFFNDISITFVDKTNPTDLLQRENYWKHTLKTFAPYSPVAVSLLVLISLT